MKITKLGQSCLLIEIDKARILTDPGSYSSTAETAHNLDAILISHEHADHLNLDILKGLLVNSPEVTLLTNKTVGNILSKNGIRFQCLEDGKRTEIKGIVVEAIGEKHAVMHPAIPQTDNTGFLINGQLLFPGDALIDPDRATSILALPVAGPWVKLSEAIDYAKTVRPKHCFPIHDGMLKQVGSTNTIPPKILEPLGITFHVLEEGKPMIIETPSFPSHFSGVSENKQPD